MNGVPAAGPSRGYPRIGAALKLSDRVAAELQRRILNGEPPPGERLPTEAELGALFAVSRSVIRDALRTLVARGLVHVGPRQGIIVTEPSHEAFGEALVLLLARSGVTMREVTEARAAIETRLGALAAQRGTEADWADMDAALVDFEAALEREDWESVHRSHLAFHLSLLGAVHMPALEILLAPMHEVILASSGTPENDRALWDFDTHPPILDALRRRDGDEVELALERHFRGFLDDERYAEFEAKPFSASQLARFDPGGTHAPRR